MWKLIGILIFLAYLTAIWAILNVGSRADDAEEDDDNVVVIQENYFTVGMN